MYKKPLSVKEVSEILKLHITTVYNLCNQGKLPYFKIGGLIKFKLEDIEPMIGLLNAKEASKILDISLKSLHNLCSQKRIKYSKLGNLLKFKLEDLEIYMGIKPIQMIKKTKANKEDIALLRKWASSFSNKKLETMDNLANTFIEWLDMFTDSQKSIIHSIIHRTITKNNFAERSDLEKRLELKQIQNINLDNYSDNMQARICSFIHAFLACTHEHHHNKE